MSGSEGYDEQSMTRRQLLRRGLLGGAGLAGAALLAACGGATGPAPASAPSSASSSAAPVTSTASSATTSGSVATSSVTSGSSAASAGARQFRLGLTGDFSLFDPAFGIQTADNNIMYDIYDFLVMRRPDLKLYPSLATEWKTINPTTWQFKLRQGVKWHHGDTFSAKDVKFTIDRIISPDSKATTRAYYATVDHVDIVDDYTVNIVTKQPDPLIPSRAAALGWAIAPMDYVKQIGDDEFRRKPSGTGILKLKEWVKADHTLFEVNKDYWGEKPPFDTVYVKAFPEMATRIAAFVKGEMDLIYQVTADHKDEINKSGKGRIVPKVYQGTYVIAINRTVPGLENKLVRQALNLAINREAIVKDLYGGEGQVVNGLVISDAFGYDPDRPPIPYDPDKARALLKQAGYNGEEMIFESSTNVVNEKQLAETLVSMFNDVGAKVKQQIIEMSVRSQHYVNHDFRGMWLSDATDYLLDADWSLWSYVQPKGIFDYWKERDPEYDRLAKEAQTSLDEKVRLADYKKLNALAMDILPMIPVLRPNLLFGVANNIDWQPNGTAIIDLRGYNLKLK